MSNQVIEIEQPFSVMDWVIEECLQGYVEHGWVEIEREEQTPNRVVRYELSHDQLGALGSVTLKEAGENSVLLYEDRLPLSVAMKGEEERYAHHRRVFRAFHARLHHHPVFKRSRRHTAVEDMLREFRGPIAESIVRRVPGETISDVARLSEQAQYKLVLLLWWAGETQPQISNKTLYAANTVRNILSELRSKYGEAVVPLARDLREQGLK